jgi:integrase
MATIGSDPNGLKRILFCSREGTRKTIRLGKVSMRQAEAFKVRVEQLVSAALLGHGTDDETSRWLKTLDEVMHGRIAAVGLVAPRERSSATLGGLIKDYFATINVKPATIHTYRLVADFLEEFFTPAKPLRAITMKDADLWHTWLRVDKKLAPATVSKWVVVARMIFRRAKKWGVISDNPFSELKAGAQTNRDRMFFVPRDAIEKVIDKCPDDEWKLIVALSRYGGLRCPSEHFALKWGDILWDENKILVHSPKTEHHDGGATRMIPLFPELRPHLLKVFSEAEPGPEHVIVHNRRANLRTRFEAIIRRAGVTPWPRVFHNLRATRQTELAERFPAHVVCAWLGNSEEVAKSHYLQLTDSHFAAASKPDGTQAAQNPAQQSAVLPRMEPQPVFEGDAKPLHLLYDASQSELVRNCRPSNKEPHAR